MRRKFVIKMWNVGWQLGLDDPRTRSQAIPALLKNKRSLSRTSSFALPIKAQLVVGGMETKSVQNEAPSRKMSVKVANLRHWQNFRFLSFLTWGRRFPYLFLICSTWLGFHLGQRQPHGLLLTQVWWQVSSSNPYTLVSRRLEWNWVWHECSQGINIEKSVDSFADAPLGTHNIFTLL